jgi:hypothetical protein
MLYITTFDKVFDKGYDMEFDTVNTMVTCDKRMIKGIRKLIRRIGM